MKRRPFLQALCVAALAPRAALATPALPIDDTQLGTNCNLWDAMGVDGREFSLTIDNWRFDGERDARGEVTKIVATEVGQ